MNPKNASSQSFSLIRLIVKGVISIVVIALILSIAAFFVLPSLLSSDFGRKKVVAVIAKETQRPVSIDKLSFSWKKGVAVTGLTIKNQDQSPLLALNDFKVTISWPALLARKISVQTLIIDGIKVTLTRDASGKTNISDLLEAPGKETPARKEPKPLPKEIPALFLDAHLKNGNFIFIDQRLDTTTRIQNLNADVSVRSLTEPIELLLNGEIVVNEKSPDQFAITALVHLAPEGRIDPWKAQGKMEMKAGFGSLNALFDLAKFDTAGEATGASLSCFIDLKKLAQMGAGILGFPPGFSLQGRLETNLEARGNLQSQITILGDTRLHSLLIAGGPFKDAPFKEPRIDFSQDILLNFSDNSINIKGFKFKSGFANVSINGMIRDFTKNPNGNLLIAGNGNLHEIVRLLEKTSSLPPDLKISGTMNVSLSATGDPTKVTIKGTTDLKGLRVDAAFLGGHPFQEKLLQITPDILISIPKNTVDITSLRIRGKTLKADVGGTVDNESNIDLKANLSTSFPDLKKQLQGVLPPAFPSKGRLSSDLTIKGNLKKLLSIKGTHSIKEVLVTIQSSDSTERSYPSPVTLSTPQITLLHDFDYSGEQESLIVNKLQADSEFLSFDGSGTVSSISSQPSIKSKGKLLLKMEELQKFLGALLPKELTAKGEGKLDFSGEGTLVASETTSLLSSWNGQGALSLDSIEYQGFGTIQDLRSTEFTLTDGLLRFTLECLLNNGPSQFDGTLDFRRKKPDFKMNLEGKDLQISQDLEVLGYFIPILISSSSGKLSGKGNFSVQASWKGTDWDKEVSRTVTGKGTLNLKDGILKSEDVLSLILKSFGKPETLEFEEILTAFRLGEGKIYNDNIQVDGKDLQFGLQGWTSLIYEPRRKGNPIDYTVTGDFLKQSLGKDGKKILAILGGGESIVPVGIGGTVQKPKVSIKMPKAEDLFRGLFSPPK